MTFTIRTAAEITLAEVRDRAYAAMYASEAKYGHRSAPHCVAWAVFADAGALQEGLKGALLAFEDAQDMARALGVVEAFVKARRPAQALRAQLAALVARPHMIATPADQESAA